GGLPFAPDPSHPSVLEILPGSPATVYGELTLLRGGALEGALENTGGEGLEVTVHRDGKVVDYRWVDGDEPFSCSLLPGEYEVRVSRWDPDEEISVPLRTIPGVIVTAGGITDMDAIDMGDPGT